MPAQFKVWGADNRVYGPVALDVIQQWIGAGSVLPASWLQSQVDGNWRRAGDLPDLTRQFPARSASAEEDLRWAMPRKVNLDEIRQFPVVAGLSDALVVKFASFGEFMEADPDEVIIRKGDPCDAVYFVMSGVLRVRLLIGCGPDERELCKVRHGEIFGEVGMFLNVTRTADVLAETNARLMRITENTFQLMVSQIPELTASVLFALAGTMARRIVDDNQRFYKEVTGQFLWR